jgi:hypothetical protein
MGKRLERGSPLPGAPPDTVNAVRRRLGQYEDPDSVGRPAVTCGSVREANP